MSSEENLGESANFETQPQPETRSSAQIGTMAWLTAAVWFGLIAGFLELVPVHLKTWLVQSGIYRKNPNLVWTIPVSLVLIFLAVALVLEVARRLFPSLKPRFLFYVIGSLTCLAPLLAVPGVQALASLVLAVGLASWLVPILLADTGRFERLVRRTLPWLALVLLVIVGVSLGKGPLAEWRAGRVQTAPSVDAPNVLLIVMDTVRADAMSFQGYSRNTTPRLAELATRGVKFERAIAAAPWTLPSHASMFTGRWPWQVEVGLDRALDTRFPTLAEFLASRGYATAGFIANTVFCSKEYGLSRGFTHYEDYVTTPAGVFRASALGWWIAKRLGGVIDFVDIKLGVDPRHVFEGDDYRKDASRINRDALRWLEQQKGRPFFVFLNYLDAHDPYLLPPGKHPHFGLQPKTLADFQLLRNWEEHDKRTCTPADLTMARDAYDDCLASLDLQLGKLFDTLDEKGFLKNTVVIITSDHGEHFGEHKRDGRAIFGHRASLYQPEIHVPLLIIAPDKVTPGTSVPGAVSLRDLPATILDLLGLAPEKSFPGASLVNPLRNWTTNTGKTANEPVLSEFSSRTDLPAVGRYSQPVRGLLRSIVEGDKAVSYTHLDVYKRQLYDLAEDPGETHDLSKRPEYQETLLQLRTTLDGLIPPPAKKAPRS